jgi:hypothetical protein
MTHPTITQFEHAAELLDIASDPAPLDEAIVRLAAWMDLAREHLTEDDMTVLIGIGGILYREGLRRRGERS